MALRPNNSWRLSFLGGNPYLEAPPASIANFLPGLAGPGPGFGPDMLINGMSPTLTLDGNTNAPGAVTDTGNRAIIYAPSEGNIVTGGTFDVFGFGAGILIPGFGVNNAYDVIDVNNAGGAQNNDPVAEVDVNNNGNGDLLSINVIEASFVQDGPASPLAVLG